MILAVVMLLAAAPASTSSLERLTSELLKPIEANGFAGPVGVYVEGAPAPLSRAVASLVMAQLAQRQLGPVPVEAKEATDAERIAREKGLRSLMRLTLSFEPPKLVARGDALSTWVNFWSGDTPTRTGPAAALAASVDADLEALTLAGAPGPSVPTSRTLELNLGIIARTPGWPSALVLADLDGDKKCELVALVDDTLMVWSADGKLKQRLELQTPMSTHPTREPFGLLTWGANRLQAWTSRREKPENFSWQREGLRSLGALDTITLYTVTFTPRPGFASFAPQLTWAGKNLTWPEPLQSVSSFGPMLLGVGPNGGAAIARGVAPTSTVAGLGSGSTLTDLDGDGTPELVATGPRSSGETDEVRVVSLGAFESAQARGGNLNELPALWTRRVEGRVIVGSTGDLDGDGIDEVVLGAWLPDGSSEFIVIRRSP